MIYTLTPNPGLDRTLIVPELRHNDVLRASSVRLDWGGKGFNVSRALAAFGLDSIALGFAGGGTGRMLGDGLRACGVQTDFTWISGETRTNTIVQQANSPEHLKINEVGPVVSLAEQAALFDKVKALAQPGSLWVLAGSLPPGVPANFYARLVTLLREQSAAVFLDASGEALRLGCVAGPDLIKPNQEEAAEISGIQITDIETARQAARRLLALGARQVALSLGSAGLLLVTAEHSVLAIPPSVQVKMVTGAESTLAGLVWASTRGLPLAEIARWGAAAGTAAVRHEGVAEIIPAEVEEITRKTKIITED